MNERDASLRLTVSAEAVGERLDRFLAGPLGSRSAAQGAIDRGAVTVDGRRRPKRHALTAGQLVEVAGAADPARAEPAADEPAAEYGVVWEDAHLIVVDKPAGLVVHPARGHRTGTLAQALAGRAAGGDDPVRAGIVHRLDRDTSGLLVVARDETTHRRLKAALAARELHREYVALADGIPEARTGTIEAPIGRDPHDRTLMAVVSGGREARTHFEITELLRGEALLRVVLDTGRTHQIRVHLAAIGHPVVGDEAYGGPVRYGLTRQFLHAERLSFRHPVTGEELDLHAPLPADLAAALEAARARAE